MTSLRSSAALLALLVWLIAAEPAAAHSERERHATPAAGSIVTSAPGLSIVLSAAAPSVAALASSGERRDAG
jgi:hypothetical protein